MESTRLDEFCGTQFWNHSLTWDTDDPDFTKCFEKTVLVWIPCAFLWIFSPFEIYFIKNSKKKNIPWNWLNLCKLLVILILIVINASDLVNSAQKSSPSVDVYSPIIKCGTFLFSAVLVYHNRKSGLRVSGHQFLFWFLLTLSGIPQFRTEIRGSQNITPESYYGYISYIIYYPLAVLMFSLSCFADKPPQYSNFEKTAKPSPEDNAGFLARLLFTWFDKMALLGYRQPLEQKDLWDINPEHSSKEVVPLYQKHWLKAVEKCKRHPSNVNASYKNGAAQVNTTPIEKKKTVSILPPLFKTFGTAFIFGTLLKVIQDMLSFISPQILNSLITFAKGDQEMWKGYTYAFVLVAVASVQTMLLNQFFKRMWDIGLKMRTSLISTIYRKALRLSNAARKENTVGQIVNLMAVDAQKFVELPMHMNTIWSTPLQIILAIYFLWQELGPSVLAGLIVMIVLIPLNVVVANRMKLLQVKQMKSKDERVKLMNEILSGIKILKLYAWEESFENQVLKIREKEIKVLKTTAYLSALNWFIFSCTPFLVSLVTFGTYVLVDENNVLDANKIFVSISLLNILRMPLTMLPMMISVLLQAVVSIKRINNFMNSDELDEDNVTHEENEADPLIMENGNFSWGEQLILKKINIRIKPKSLNAVVGSVGSGKSSLLSAFLGEMIKISGRVNTVGSIAYVAQQAWIQNATLKDNILFGKDLDEKKYRKVVEACALKTDFEMLPGGDQTEIGEKGINLSGGQKQRVSLARAVYADADIYLLDDPLSAVDSHVGKHIFDKVVGPTGILKDKTRILVTHGITYLPQTDKILVLTKGEISESGTYQELLNKKGAFAEFLALHLNDQIDNEDLEQIKTQLEGTAAGEFIRQISKISESGSEKANGLMQRQLSITSIQSEKSVKDAKPIRGKKLIEAEKAETGNVSFQVYKHYLQSIGFSLISSTCFLSFIFQCFGIGSNIWLSEWAEDKDMYKNGSVDVSKRNMYLGVYATMGLGQVIAVCFSVITLFVGTIRAAKKLHQLLLNNILKMPTTTFYDVTPVGRILNRFSKDVDTLDNILPMTIRGWMNCFFSVLGTIIVISYTSPTFIAVIIPIGIIYFFIQRFFVATSRQLRRIESVSRSPIYSHFSETITGVQSIRAFGQQQRFILESERYVDENQMSQYPNMISHRWLGVRLEMIGNSIIFFAALFAVISKDKLPGLVGLSVAYALQVTGALNWLVRVTSDVETNIISVERIKEYIEAPQEAPWDIPDKNPQKTWPEAGAVEFKNYAVRYRPGLDLVLKGVDFSVEGGEKIGIVGRTGAGKSSLTMSLFRIIEAAKGAIFIDGVKISELGLHALRSRLTIIPQDAILFSGTLRMNVDPFDIYSDEDVWRSLEHAHLKTFVKGLPAGLQHEVTEGGENLSVGQRQLICLARALLRKTKVLILDEATAAVDLETDDLIQKTIRTEFKDCTVLTIAHRLNTIMDSDRVLVLDKGEIVEFDTPENLLLDAKSIFYGMCKDAGLV